MFAESPQNVFVTKRIKLHSKKAVGVLLAVVIDKRLFAKIYSFWEK
jgi:hypothetical protein